MRIAGAARGFARTTPRKNSGDQHAKRGDRDGPEDRVRLGQKHSDEDDDARNPHRHENAEPNGTTLFLIDHRAAIEVVGLFRFLEPRLVNLLRLGIARHERIGIDRQFFTFDDLVRHAKQLARVAVVTLQLLDCSTEKRALIGLEVPVDHLSLIAAARHAPQREKPRHRLWREIAR